MLIINEAKYIDGACISAYTYRKYGHPSIKHIVMIDKTISKSGIEKLTRFFDEIYLIEPTFIKSNYEVSSEKRKERYGAWIDYALTKWNILRMTQFKKVLLCDIDTLVYADYTKLFTLKTPAWCMFHKKILDNDVMTGIVKEMKTGHKLSERLVTKFSLGGNPCSGEFTNFIPINTSLTLVTPSVKDYNALMRMVYSKIEKYGYYPILNSGEYGITPDDSALFEYYHCHTDKRSYIIGPEYLITEWRWKRKHPVFSDIKNPIILNYDTTDKPWLKEEHELYKDEKIWARYKKMLKL